MKPERKPVTTASPAVLALIQDLESAAHVLTRAKPAEAEALMAALTVRMERLGPGSEMPPELGDRACRALAAFAAAVTVLRASNEARLSALLNAARPAAGYTGAGQFSRNLDYSVRGSA
ncbi:MAG: hypothetical protein IPL06_11465 [Betaproteobacteria bacterium]|nr:hypothetical protein [Betaproteobacteria bacterium]